MKSYFYNRTSYPHINIPVPQCFIDLDNIFDMQFSDYGEMLSSTELILAENTSRRMADIEMYAQLINSALHDPNLDKAASLIGSFLVGYFSSCKSLLDAGSITLAELYCPELANKERDFSKRNFWNRLRKQNENAYNRYLPFRDLMKEIIHWRDATVHRLTPIVLVTGPPGNPDTIPAEDKSIRMVNEPDVDYGGLRDRLNDDIWVSPLEIPRRWRDSFIELCQKICIDIGQSFE